MMNVGAIELISKLKWLAKTDKSRPEDWAWGQKTDYLKHAAELQEKFNIRDDAIPDYEKRPTAD